MINKCHHWQLTMTYYDILCTMLKVAWITPPAYWASLICLCARQQTLGQGTGGSVSELWPCPLPQMGRSSSVSRGSLDSSLCIGTLSPEASNQSGERFLCQPANAKYWTRTFWPTQRRQRSPASAQTCTDSLACRGPQQFPANFFVLYTVLTKSLCLTHTLFRYSNG